MLSRIIPGPLVRLFARRYVAGGSMEEGIDVARRLLDDRLILSSMDLLGEAVDDPEQVLANVRIYRELIDALSSDRRFTTSGYPPGGSAVPSVSLKPSCFTIGEQEEAAEHIRGLCRRAHESGVAITIDMEDHPWTDFTLDLSVSLFEEGLDVGAVLQTRLHRTEADLERIPAGMRVRLVIGIYPEPEEIALVDKAAMKERMLTYAARLLERGATVEFATHDEGCLERFLTDVAPAAPERCEIQMLLGVPRDRFVRRLREGAFGLMLPVRLYVPFAVGWADATAYLRRRMRETPNMMWLVLRNLIPRRK